MAPIVVIVMLVLLAVSPVLFRGVSSVSAERVAAVMSLNESEAIRDHRLLVRCGVVMVVVLVGFIVAPVIHIAPSLVALLGAGVLILTSRSLALRGDLGGNLTAVGSSANIVMLGIAMRSGHPISFAEFARKGIVVTTISTALCAAYLWLRYFVFA